MRKLLLYILLFCSFSGEAQYTKHILTAGTWGTTNGVTMTGRRIAFGYHHATPLANGRKAMLVVFLHGIDHRGVSGDTTSANGIDKVTQKGIPLQIKTADIPAMTIPGGVSPADDVPIDVIFPQCDTAFDTWPQAYPVEMVQWAIANMGSQIDTNRIIEIGYSLGAGGAEGSTGNSYLNPRLSFVGIEAMGYNGATNYQYIADSGLPLFFFGTVNDPLAKIILTDNLVKNLNSYHPVAPVQYIRFTDLPNTLGGVTQHDRIWPVVNNLTPGTNYTLTNGDTWTQTTLLKYALQFTNKRKHR